jgi:hypothetical protein
MHLALADISIVPVFAGRITSALGLGGRFQFGPWNKFADVRYWPKADMS